MEIYSRFFNHYIIHPFSHQLSPCSKAVACLASAFFLIITLGGLHILAYQNERNYSKSPLQGNLVSKKLPPLFSPPPPKSRLEVIAQTPIDNQGNKVVCFYKTGPTEFLGNFAVCPRGIQIFGRTFRCSEAAFQWRKYTLIGIQDPKIEEFVTADGEKAFQLNRYFEGKYPGKFAPGWINGERDKIMWHVLRAKFLQNPEYRQLLDQTQGAYLLEHNQDKRDNYWSDNSDGSGKNMLGKMLMAIRNHLPQPKVDDDQNRNLIVKFAQWANQPNSLKYSIF